MRCCAAPTPHDLHVRFVAADLDLDRIGQGDKSVGRHIGSALADLSHCVADEMEVPALARRLGPREENEKGEVDGAISEVQVFRAVAVDIQ